jgi:hypothetical protein
MLSRVAYQYKAGTASPSGVQEFTPVFSEVRVARKKYHYIVIVLLKNSIDKSENQRQKLYLKR